MARYHRMFQWFPDQPNLAPINVCHFNILQNIFQFLLTTTDLWVTPDIKTIFAMGDSIVALYDRPLEVVDLTTNNLGAMLELLIVRLMTRICLLMSATTLELQHDHLLNIFCRKNF